MNNLTISLANLEDSSEIAKLIIVAAGGLIEFLLHDLVDDVSIEQLVTFEVENQQSELSYSKTEVAKLNGQILGMANFYPADEHQITREMRKFFPKERLEVLEEFYNSRVDNSLFLNALAVKAEYRGQSIGTQLIESVKKKPN